MDLTDILLLLGGIGLFLFGMTIMSTGLRNACGDRLRVILEKATRNRVTAALAGIGVTIFIQSSSATDVMVIGFVSSGLMTLSQALGVIMGANIGTTITAQITAFNIGAYAPGILFVGAVLYLFFKRRLVKNIGSVIMGFGMLFHGVTMMKSVIAPLAQTEGFSRAIAGLDNPVVTILFGIVFTALLQSSSSATVIFQAFAMQGIISYHTAVYLLIGTAIGAVTPNLLAGLTANKAGKRCSILNLVFNILRAALILLIITVIPGFLTLIQNLSPGDIARQIANTHTAFALISVLILLPFSKWIVRITERIIPVTAMESRGMQDRKLVYMIQTDKVPPAIALDQAHREITRMGHIAVDNLLLSLECFFELNEEKAEQVLATEESVDYLTKAILARLLEMRALDFSKRQMSRLYHMIQAVDDMERISDHAENIAEYEAQMKSGSTRLTEEALSDLKELADLAAKNLQLGLSIFEDETFEKIREVQEIEDQVDTLQEQIIDRHVNRLVSGTCQPHAGIIFTDMSIDLERCSDHAMNIAEELQ